VLLQKKSISTQGKYNQHYKEFIRTFDKSYKYGEPIPSYSQRELDAYAATFWERDEGQSVQLQRVAALKLFLVQCQGFALNFKDFSKKSVKVQVHHKYLDDATVKLILTNAKEHSDQMFVFLSLLLDMAARAQDVIGITYSKILDGKRNRDGRVVYYEVSLAPKKTSGKYLISSYMIQPL
jgi:hypothetical protein